MELIPQIAPSPPTTPSGLTFSDWLPVASPGWTWHWRHLAFIRRQVDRVLSRWIDRLMVFVPPRHGKSEQITVRLPAFLLECDPTFRALVACHSTDLAKGFSRKTRRLVRERGRVISRDQDQVTDWGLEEGGGLRAAGVGTAIAGIGAHGVFADDLVRSRKDANSPAYRNTCWDWWVDDVMTRLEPAAFVILQMTRWHVDDVPGRILASEEADEWTVVNLPALATANDPLGRLVGEALCPQRYDEDALARLQRRMRSSFTALFQGVPVALEGNIIKKEWFRYYRTPHARYRAIVQSWDTANKDNEADGHAPSVCTTWGIHDNGADLLDVYRDWLQFPALLRAAKSQAEKWKPDSVLIEDKASGQQLIQSLRESTLVPAVPIEPDADKITRLAVHATDYEAGLVRHPESAGWLIDFEEEITTAPSSAYMDQCDSLSQFLRWFRRFAVTLEVAGAGLRASAEAPGGTDLADLVDDTVGFGVIRGGNDYTGF